MGRVTKDLPPQIVIIIIIMANIVNTYMPGTVSGILEGKFLSSLQLPREIGSIISILQTSKLRHGDVKQFVKGAVDPGFESRQSSCTSKPSITKLYASQSTEEDNHLSTSD